MSEVLDKAVPDGAEINARSQGKAVSREAGQTAIRPRRGVVARFVLTSLAHCACAHYPVHPELLKHAREHDA